MARRETIVVSKCNRCDEEAATDNEIRHKEWCGRTWMVDAQGMLHPRLELRTIRWERRAAR